MWMKVTPQGGVKDKLNRKVVQNRFLGKKIAMQEQIHVNSGASNLHSMLIRRRQDQGADALPFSFETRFLASASLAELSLISFVLFWSREVFRIEVLLLVPKNLDVELYCFYTSISQSDCSRSDRMCSSEVNSKVSNRDSISWTELLLISPKNNRESSKRIVIFFIPEMSLKFVLDFE